MAEYTDEQFQQQYSLVRSMARIIVNIDFIELKRHIEKIADDRGITWRPEHQPYPDYTEFINRTMRALDHFNGLKTYMEKLYADVEVRNQQEQRAHEQKETAP